MANYDLKFDANSELGTNHRKKTTTKYYSHV